MTLTLLAQTAATLPDPASAQSIGWLILALAGLAAAVNQVMGIVDKLRAKKSQPVDVTNAPLTVRGHVEYTPIAVHREFAKEVNERFSTMSKASSEGRQKIYELIRAENTAMQNRFTELVGLVREIKGKIERNTNPPHST